MGKTGEFEGNRLLVERARDIGLGRVETDSLIAKQPRACRATESLAMEAINSARSSQAMRAIFVRLEDVVAQDVGWGASLGARYLCYVCTYRLV